MPTLPMYKLPPAAEASHQVLSPGGYETWRLDLTDPASNLHLVATLMLGCPYYPPYARRYQAYAKNPTTHTPPLPPDSPAAHLSVYRDGQLLHDSLTLYPATTFSASNHLLDVRPGFNRLWHENGAYRLSLRGRPTAGRNALLAVDLTLACDHPHESYDVRLFTGGAVEHHWAPVALSCAATGAFAFRESRDAQPVTTPVNNARASLDHDYGTSPLGQSFLTWARGTAFFPDGSATGFHFARLLDHPDDDLAYLIDSSQGGRPLPVASPRGHWTKSNARLPYPTSFDAGPDLRLDNPRLLHATPALLRLLYDASAGPARRGHAICEILHPQQLLHPLRSLPLKRSFHLPKGEFKLLPQQPPAAPGA